MMQLLTVKEVAELLRVHPATLYRLIYRHEFPSFRIGSEHRVSQEFLEQWIKDRSEYSHHNRGRRRGRPVPQESR